MSKIEKRLTPVPKPTRKKKERNYNISKSIKSSCPLEEDEQAVVIQWLELKGICYCASMMGAFLHPSTYGKMKKIGAYQKGFPDIIIYDPPKITPYSARGIAIEMKRTKGGVVAPEQLDWHKKFTDRNWIVKVCYGADEAIEFLKGLYK